MEPNGRHMSRAAPFRVLFLCTGNSARSQIAEALLQRKGRGDFEVASAGSDPAPHVHPLTLEVLGQYGIDWSSRRPKGLEAVCGREWDFVITVCDRARESCPSFPGQPVFAHWGMPDPAAVVGTLDEQRHVFQETLVYLSRRLDLMLSLPLEKLEHAALEQRVRAIGSTKPGAVFAAEPSTSRDGDGLSRGTL